MVHSALTREKEKALPKQKFSFKNKPKKRPGEEKIKENYETVKEEMKDVQELIDPEIDLVIRKKKNEILKIDPSEYEGKDKIYLENIENCDIYLPFIIKALFVKNTYHSRIYAGIVLGSSYIETTNKSSYYITSHQVRIHKANEVNFYLQVKNGPIIEDCQKLKFGPNLYEYNDQEKHAEMTDFDDGVNKYRDVKDFKWLKQEQSPNWSLFTDEEIDNMTKVY